jgi:hypothetical protein
MVAAYIGEFVLAREVALSIIEAQWESGIIPSPPGAGASLRRSIKLKNEKHAQFLENYHTTFVSVIFLGQIRAMCAPGT